MLERILPNSEITNENALESKVKGNFDVVIENPPFGRVGEIGDIDHAIAMHSLEGMKEDGKAVLILGGVQSTPKKAVVRAIVVKPNESFTLTYTTSTTWWIISPPVEICTPSRAQPTL
jgi:predicted RNA methylase